MDIADKTVKFPDVTAYGKDGVTHGFFESFKGEIKINEDIDTSNVINMTFMFYSATKANPNVSKWDTSKVTDMRSMFYGATSANPDVSDSRSAPRGSRSCRSSGCTPAPSATR